MMEVQELFPVPYGPAAGEHRYFDFTRFTKTSGAAMYRRFPQRDDTIRRRNADHAAFFAANGRRARVLTVLTVAGSGELVTVGLGDLLDTISATPNLDWLLLMPKDAKPSAFERLATFLGRQFSNVWIGASITSQRDADLNCNPLLSTPAFKHFVRVQPVSEPVDFQQVLWWPDQPDIRVDVLRGGYWKDKDQVGVRGFVGLSDLPAKIDWLICGGGAEIACHPKWIRILRDQALAAEVPLFFTGWGDFWPLSLDENGLSAHGLWPPGSIVPRAESQDAIWWPGADELGKKGLSDWYSIRVGPMLSGAVIDGSAWHQAPAR